MCIFKDMTGKPGVLKGFKVKVHFVFIEVLLVKEIEEIWK